MVGKPALGYHQLTAHCHQPVLRGKAEHMGLLKQGLVARLTISISIKSLNCYWGFECVTISLVQLTVAPLTFFFFAIVTRLPLAGTVLVYYFFHMHSWIDKTLSKQELQCCNQSFICQNCKGVAAGGCVLQSDKVFRLIYLFCSHFPLICCSLNCLLPSFTPCSLIDLSTLSSLCNYICIRVKSVCNGLKQDWTKQIFLFLVTETILSSETKQPTGCRGKAILPQIRLKTALCFLTGYFGQLCLFIHVSHPFL